MNIRVTSLVSVIFAGALLVITSCSGNRLAPGNQAPSGQSGASQQQTVATPLPASGRITQNTSPQKSPGGLPPVTVEIVFDMGQAAGPGLDVYKGDFKLQSIYVPAGTTVTWVNKEDFLQNQHTVTSKEGLFDKVLAFGESFSYTFTKPGTYAYYCKAFPIMTGEIVVQ